MVMQLHHRINIKKFGDYDGLCHQCMPFTC